jgi:hypothetical protein
MRNDLERRVRSKSRGEYFQGLTDIDDTGEDWNFVAGEALRVAAAVPVLVQRVNRF